MRAAICSSRISNQTSLTQTPTGRKNHLKKWGERKEKERQKARSRKKEERREELGEVDGMEERGHMEEVRAVLSSTPEEASTQALESKKQESIWTKVARMPTMRASDAIYRI